MESIETLREHGTRCELARTYLTLDQAGGIFQELGAKLDLGKIDELDSQLASENTTIFGKRSEANV